MDVVKTIPYVPDLLAALEVRQDMPALCVGSLTGNVMETAFMKLKAAGLDQILSLRHRRIRKRSPEQELAL